MDHKPSFGNGYGINRNLKGDQAFAAAAPARSPGVVHPGQNFSRPMTGKSGAKHFMGAKIAKKTHP